MTMPFSSSREALRGRTRRHRGQAREGKVLVLLTLLTPAIFGLLAVVIDGSYMQATLQNLQNITDAGALAAAMDLKQGADAKDGAATAAQYMQGHNGLEDASLTVFCPPTQGAYAGKSGFVEVIVGSSAPSFFSRTLQTVMKTTLSSRAVAGYEPTTAGAGIVVLDPSPAPLSVAIDLPALPSLPTIVGGLEILGLGDVRVNGAVLVNNEWGGVDENGNPAGADSGPPYAISCTPLLALTKLRAVDIRVAGGVDKPSNYGSYATGRPSPLRANKLPVPDPFLSLPVPTIGVDPAHVRSSEHGGIDILAALGPAVELEPGVYDWIQVIAGKVTFSPGVYIIRNVSPLTGMALSLAGGQITADGVMFYITDTADYSPEQGTPDALDGDAEPTAPGVSKLVPSVQIDLALPGSSFSPISDPSSPFYGVMLFQRRYDRRPVVLIQQQLLWSNSFSGVVYAKWGHVMLVGSGKFGGNYIAGTMRIVTLLDCTLSPTKLLPPAEDVFLVE